MGVYRKFQLMGATLHFPLNLWPPNKDMYVLKIYLVKIGECNYVLIGGQVKLHPSHHYSNYDTVYDDQCPCQKFQFKGAGFGH